MDLGVLGLMPHLFSEMLDTSEITVTLGPWKAVMTQVKSGSTQGPWKLIKSELLQSPSAKRFRTHCSSTAHRSSRSFFY